MSRVFVRRQTCHGFRVVGGNRQSCAPGVASALSQTLVYKKCASSDSACSSPHVKVRTHTSAERLLLLIRM